MVVISASPAPEHLLHGGAVPARLRWTRLRVDGSCGITSDID